MFIYDLYVFDSIGFKAVPLHSPITLNTFQFKQKNMTNVACFHGQHFSCLEGI